MFTLNNNTCLYQFTSNRNYKTNICINQHPKPTHKSIPPNMMYIWGPAHNQPRTYYKINKGVDTLLRGRGAGRARDADATTELVLSRCRLVHRVD